MPNADSCWEECGSSDTVQNQNQKWRFFSCDRNDISLFHHFVLVPVWSHDLSRKYLFDGSNTLLVEQKTAFILDMSLAELPRPQSRWNCAIATFHNQSLRLDWMRRRTVCLLAGKTTDGHSQRWRSDVTRGALLPTLHRFGLKFVFSP